MAKLHTLQDNFNDNSLDTSKWYNGGFSETGGVLQASLGSGEDSAFIESDLLYDLTGSYVLFEVSTINEFTLAGIDAGSGNWAGFSYYGGTLRGKSGSGGGTQRWSTTYDSEDHKWLRLREASGTFYWDASPDGTNWTNLGSYSVTITITSVYALFYVDTVDGPFTVAFDNFNTVPVTNLTPTTTDSVTVSEAVQTKLTSHIGVSDTVTLAEQVLASITTKPAVEDIISVTDLPKLKLVSHINPSEVVTLSESVNVQLVGPTPIPILATEQVAVDESINVAVQTAIKEGIVNEHIQVTDIPNLKILINVAGVTDNVTVTDTPKIVLLVAPTASDTVTVTENVSVKTSDPQATAQELIQLTEDVALAVSSPQPNLSDLVTVGEVINLAIVSKVGTQEAVTLTEDIAVKLTSYLHPEESVTVSESVSARVSDPKVTAVDSVTVDEDVIILVSTPTSFVNVSDHVTVTEDVNLEVRNVRTVAKLLIIADNRLALRITPKYPSEGEISHYVWLD